MVQQVAITGGKNNYWGKLRIYNAILNLWALSVDEVPIFDGIIFCAIHNLHEILTHTLECYVWWRRRSPS